MQLQKITSKIITALWNWVFNLLFQRNTDSIQLHSTDGIETSTLISPHHPLHSPWFVLVCVSKRWLCVSRLCPVRLLPIDSRWDLSIKHPEPCSLPNPGVIQSYPLHTHIHKHTNAYTPTSSVIHQYFHRGLYWSHTIQRLHPMQYNIRAKTTSVQV